MAMTLDGSNGVTFNDASLQGAAASPYVLKNRIINGAMQVWQRGTTFTSVASGYLADRWTFSTSLSITATQSTDVPNVQYLYSLKVVPASNGTAAEFVVRQFIEQQNITDLAGQTVTVSAWVKSSQTSLKVRLSSQNATGGVDTPQSITVTANTWTKITATFTTFSAVTAWTSTPNSSGGFLDIGYANSTALTTSDSLYITGVQLEIGTTATPFERRMYGQELALCQRYYTKFGAGYSYTSYGSGYASSATGAIAHISYPVSMRTQPTSSLSGSNRIVFSGGSTVVSGFNLGATGVLNGYFTFTSSGMTTNLPCIIGPNGDSTAYLDLSAEL
jgi:hypothetical protein